MSNTAKKIKQKQLQGEKSSNSSPGKNSIKQKLQAKKKNASTNWFPSYIIVIFLLGGVSSAIYFFNFVDTREFSKSIYNLIDRLSQVKNKNEIKIQESSIPSLADCFTILEKRVSDKNPASSKKFATVEDESHEDSSLGLSKSDFTIAYEIKIKEKLDKIYSFIETNPSKALEEFRKLQSQYPNSPRTQFGKAKAIDQLSRIKQSNQLLEECIQEYEKALFLPDVHKDFMLGILDILMNRLRFRGWLQKGTAIFQQISQQYPKDLNIQNRFGIHYLITGNIKKAKNMFLNVLNVEPGNGVALVHYGFLLATSDTDPLNAVEYLSKGINTNTKGVDDIRFYSKLGDSLLRLNRTREAREVFRVGSHRGFFLSEMQRSAYNVVRLSSSPWWTAQQTGAAALIKDLEKHWKTIRDEGVAMMDVKSGSFVPEAENLRDTGDWKQFNLYERGVKNIANCNKVPRTCAIIEKYKMATKCRRGQIKYSVIQPGTHIWPHCGPTNCRLRSHLGLIVPDGLEIRVGNEKRTWAEGKVITFDDSFEHEVWHRGSSYRLVLIVDSWHPELTNAEKSQLSSI